MKEKPIKITVTGKPDPYPSKVEFDENGVLKKVTIYSAYKSDAKITVGKTSGLS